MFRLLTQGYETFTGEIAGANFVDGATRDSLTIKQINLIGSNYYLEKELEDGTKFQVNLISPNQLSIDYIKTIEDRESGDSVVEALEIESEIESSEVDQAQEPETFKYTRAYLEAIADKSGMAGLRELAPNNIKARSVKDLIEALLTLTLPV